MRWFWSRVARVYEGLTSRLGWHRHLARLASDVNGRSLEVCCGPAVLTRLLLEQGGDAYATDYAPGMVRTARQRLTIAGLDPRRALVADVSALPFAAGAFDFVLISGAFGLLPPAVKPAALGEMARVCRGEMRLLEPVAEQSGFYWRRIPTRFFGGATPIPPALFGELGLDYELGGTAMGGVFRYVKLWPEETAVPESAV